MNPLQVPTDNLYKFVSIAGLVLSLASFLVIFQDVSHKAVLTDRYEYWKSIAEQAIVEAKTAEESDWSVAQARVERFIDANLAAREAQIIAAVRPWTMVVPGALGIALMFFGFGAWYREVQRYQDQILRAKAAASAKAADGTRGAGRETSAVETLEVAAAERTEAASAEPAAVGRSGEGVGRSGDDPQTEAGEASTTT